MTAVRTWPGDDPHIEAISLAWEAKTGADSIPTIERLYERTPSGAIVCCWPECPFCRHDAVLLWRHVHSAHGRDDLPPANFDWGAYF